MALEDESDVEAEARRMESARSDPRMVDLRQNMLEAIRATVDLWSTDAAMSDVCLLARSRSLNPTDRLTGLSQAISELFKSITALPSDATLISLPPAPLLELVCRAAQRHLTAVWLSLANMLVVQLDPPSLSIKPQVLKATPSKEVLGMVRDVIVLLVGVTLGALGRPGAMEDVSVLTPAVMNTRLIPSLRIPTSYKPSLVVWRRRVLLIFFVAHDIDRSVCRRLIISLLRSTIFHEKSLTPSSNPRSHPYPYKSDIPLSQPPHFL